MDSIDTDTLEAVQAAWRAAASLPEYVPGRPQAGDLKGGQSALYVQLVCRLQKREKVSTKGPWFDWRTLDIVVRGDKDKVVAALAALRGVFDDAVALVYPSGAKFMAFMPYESDQLSQESKGKEGRDVWRGIVGGTVWSVRR